jgi:photosystem II stability/assembly factor-like uncharacterized protein
MHSLDGGSTWTTIEGVTTQAISTGEFINADTGWIGCNHDGNDCFLFRTTDAGVTWENQADVLYSPFSSQPVQDIEFVERPGTGTMRGYATGGLSYVWMTDDYGETWESIHGGCGSGSFEACCIMDENTGWFVGYASTISNATITRMDDAGGSWTVQTNPTDQPLRGVCFADYQHGIAVGNVGTILTTDDGGDTWVTHDNSGYRWQGAFITGSGHAWAVGSDGNILHSANWGDTWQMQGCGANCELWDVFFIDDSEGWVVGGGIEQPGVLLHTTNGGVVGIEEYQRTDFVLEQNSPNPFSVTTTIGYKLERPASVNLSVYNILGEEVTTLVNKFMQTGSYTAEFSPEADFNGIYYCQLQINGMTVATRKMVLVR